MSFKSKIGHGISVFLSIVGSAALAHSLHTLRYTHLDRITSIRDASQRYVIEQQAYEINDLKSHISNNDPKSMHTSRFLEIRIPQIIKEEVEKFNSKPGIEHKLDESMIIDLVSIESSSKICAISQKGARGLGQIMPKTGGDYGIRNASELFIPETNLHIATDYAGTMLNRFDGDLNLARASYNAGPGAVERYNGIPPYEETRKYIAKYNNLSENKGSVAK